MDPPTVLVTSFGPFGAFATNPTQLVATALGQTSLPFDAKIIVEHLTVDYEEVTRRVAECWRVHRPQFVLHLGVHPQAGVVKVEQQAFGKGYCLQDVKGSVPLGNRCCETSHSVLCTELCVDAIVERVCAQLHDVETSVATIQTSKDPGKYLCGFCYYNSLMVDRNRSLFVHIPLLTERLTLELMVKIITLIIQDCLQQIDTA